ncbi:MAG: energy transducer TonB [Gracilimonas sp.]
MLKKNFSSDLRTAYPLIMEAGIILALLILILGTKIQFPESSTDFLIYVENEETALILPPQISESRVMKPPPVPDVPIEIPNDSPIEPSPITINEFDRVSRLMIPPLPNELKIEVNYELLEKYEQLPELIGGEELLRQSVIYPESAQRAGIEGIVEVEFTVDENGRVVNPKIIRGIGWGCDKAVLNGIKLMRYKPGKINGKHSSFKLKETVQFILINKHF